MGGMLTIAVDLVTDSSVAADVIGDVLYIAHTAGTVGQIETGDLHTDAVTCLKHMANRHDFYIVLVDFAGYHRLLCIYRSLCQGL